jgi:hypothetical protein
MLSAFASLNLFEIYVLAVARKNYFQIILKCFEKTFLLTNQK